VKEVHVWRIDDLDSAERFAACELLLSAGERARRERFRAERDGRRWACARAALRIVLGSYASIAPAEVAFETGPFGKPSLRDPGIDLSFNLTHTGRLALLAVCRGSDVKVGIDAEMIRADVEWEALSRRFFAPAEIEAILSVPLAQRCAAFFACWTRKEALVKAMGLGLSMPLERFAVSVTPGCAELVAFDGDPLASTCWHLVDLGDAALAAALAIDVAGPLVRWFDFDRTLR
jgi:4'-phosphopantetheinyl transferase